MRPFKELNEIMEQIPREFREHWCKDIATCDCKGSVNKLTDLTKDEWSSWIWWKVNLIVPDGFEKYLKE